MSDQRIEMFVDDAPIRAEPGVTVAASHQVFRPWTMRAP